MIALAASPQCCGFSSTAGASQDGTGQVPDPLTGEQHSVNCWCKTAISQGTLAGDVVWELCAWASAGVCCLVSEACLEDLLLESHNMPFPVFLSL